MPGNASQARSRAIWSSLVFGLAALTVIPARPAAAGAEPESRSRDNLLYANGLYRDRHYGLAAEEYARILKSAKPGREADDARYGLGNSLLFLGKYADARRELDAFLATAPDHPGAPIARFRAGEAAYFVGDLAAARAALEAFTAGNPGHRLLESAWPRLGDVYTRLEDWPKALHAYETALTLRKEGPSADRSRLGLGRALAATGEADAARGVFRELAGRENHDVADRARLELGRLEAASGHAAEAAEAFGALAQASPRGPLAAEARLGRGEALVKLGRRDEAEALLKPLAAEASQAIAVPASYALGCSQLAGGRNDEARETLDEALKRHPGAALAPALMYRAAEAARRAGQSDDARARFRAMVKEFPKDPWSPNALIQAADLALRAHDAGAGELAGSFAQAYPGHRLLPQARLIEARAALDSGKAAEAIPLLKEALAAEKPDAETADSARYYLVMAYRAAGEKDKAAEALDELTAKAPAAGPTGEDSRFRLGQAQVLAGRYRDAIAPLEAYLKGRPDGEAAENALAYLAWAKSELGQAEAAGADLKTLADRFPRGKTLAPTRVRLAEAAFAAKSYPAAAELFRPVAEGDDLALRPRAQSGLGWALLLDGKAAEAAAAFGALLSATPEDPLAPEAALARGRALDEAGKPDEALAAYQSLLEKYPKAKEAAPGALARARLLAKAGHPAEAADGFAKYLEEHPGGEPDGLDALLAEEGWALLDAGKSAEADKAFDRLLGEFPESPRAAEARLNLAESAYQAKDYDRVGGYLAPLVAEGATAEPATVQAALYRLGRTRVESKDWKGASEAFGRLVEGYPDGSFRREARFWQAEAAFQAGDAKEAEAAFGALAAEPLPAGAAPEPWLATVRLRGVQSLVLLERWSEALAAAEALAASVPADYAPRAEIDYARGRSLQGLARFDEARDAYQAVIDARKGGDLAARAQLMRGETFFHQQQYQEAGREFLKVDILYHAPRWQATALLEAGKVYERLDKWADAAELYKKLQARFPADPAAAEAGRRLEAAAAHAAAGVGDASVTPAAAP